MSKQKKFIVELVTNEDLSLVTSRAQHVAELQRAAREAKDQILRRLPEFRSIDPLIQVTSQQDSIFPILFVTTTDAVKQMLASDPIVKSISLERPTFTLASGPSGPRL
jgi:hypothetical protein